MFDATLAFFEHGFMTYIATRVAPERIGNRHPFVAPFDAFQAADRHFVICCGNDHLFGALCRVIGRPDLAIDARFVVNEVRMKNQAELEFEMEREFKKRPADHWLAVIHEAGVPVAPILNVAEAAELPQTAARNMVIEAGGIRMPGNPIKISGYDDPRVRVGAPSLNRHSAALREEFAAASVGAAIAA